VAWALTRGAPIARVLNDVITPLVLGHDALAIPALLDRIDRQLSLLGTEGLVQRAISLIDIALWDIKGRVARQPVWRLLGGFRTQAPTLLVDLYPKPGQDVASLVDKIVARVEQGYSALKIHGGDDPAKVGSVLGAARETVGSTIEFVIDVSMAWRELREAIAALRQWAPYEPAWVEDPCRADKLEWIRRLRELSPIPIGAGDEVANPLAMQQLISAEAVDVVRLDATCQGGFSGFSALAAHAHAHGCAISPHTYPEIHQHCVFALPGIPHLELFLPQSPYDCTDAFLEPESLVHAVSGVVCASERPGLGVSIDWEAVEARALIDR
jgi:L-alanine-DL-glutamate epimerase-like enolase superfamily enzyme